ncbi:MAG: hypothetical protein ACOY0T_14960 [Myxococcota bacterium]
MATACLFIGFNRPHLGREAEAWRALDSSIEALESFKQQGYCESYEAFGLTPHCGSMNNFLLLKGERAKLDELRRTDAFERFSITLARLLDGYGVVPGVTQEGIRQVRERLADLLK